MRVTSNDQLAANELRDAIAAINADTLSRFPDSLPSEWQYVETVLQRLRGTSRFGVRTRSKINRLVELGLAETMRSDGFGPQVRVIESACVPA